MAISPLQLEELHELQQEYTGFRVTDLNSANWAFRKLAALKAKEAEVKALANGERERIQAWEDRELETNLQSQEFFMNLLTQFHREQLEKDPKAKTISTIYGKLKSVTRGPQPKSEDEEAILSYLKSAGMTEHIKVVEKPAWGDYKKSLRIVQEGDEWYCVDESGHRVPGVSVELGGTSFKVEVSD